MRILAFLSLILVLTSCDDDDAYLVELNLNFEHHVDNEVLVFNEINYENNSDEFYSISELKYIISNIQLQNKNGNWFSYPVEDSYFLINAGVEESLIVNLSGIPNGNYQNIRFGFGVDQSNYPLNGVNNFVPTAEENDMLWSWSAGYIFLKFEGEYQLVDPIAPENFLYHVGSHGQNLDNYRTVELAVDLDLNADTQLDISADVSKIFDATHQMSLQQKSDIQIDPENAPKIADNVVEMFQIQMN
ncbi:MbnP family protein [Psychroflexus aestuariivivens]|uniref:MbnP family protein n=1 Tax=Psychroflexus aestuariivivens TaxID=1795040 RepID=UPI001F0329F2|nr:MbnP family protein [Psychroflexus aestuariivivens]